MTNLFTTHPIEPTQLTAISTSVGSGKTQAAIAYMAQPCNLTRNFVYVAPTVALVNQTRKDLEARIEQLGGSGRNLFLIHSQEKTGRPESISEQVLDKLNSAIGGVGHVVLCTTTTFLDVLARIKRPEDWSVLLDEAFAPVEFLEVQLGERKGTRKGAWGTFLDLFQVVPEQGNRVVPAPERLGLVRQISDRNWKSAGLQYQGFQRFAAAVTNPALRVELVGSPEAVLEDSADPMVACYVTPEYFLGFGEVLFLSALFEHTVLHHLWTELFGVTFQPHPVVKAENPCIRNLHQEQGPYVRIGYLLHEDDSSSLRNLSRSAVGGAEDAPAGSRVIDAMVRIADEYFWGSPYLLQTNSRYGYTEGSALVPRGATVIPVVSHGMNKWQGADCVAALAVTNPTPPQAKWVQERSGLTMQETLLSYRLHVQYQAVGRSSVRQSEGTKKPKTFLVPSKTDAEALLGIWEGSTSLGKVGNIPKLSAPKAPKAEAHARTLVAYLQSLPASVLKVSFRALKGLLGPLHEETWLAARDRALASCPGWVRSAQSACRVAS
jgi:hypothetical protein